jgi:hypothetical protein
MLFRTSTTSSVTSLNLPEEYSTLNINTQDTQTCLIEVEVVKLTPLVELA